MRRLAVPSAISITLLFGLFAGCRDQAEPTLPPVSAHHICCGAGIVTPFYVDGRWTAVSIKPLATNHTFEFSLTMTHPFEQYFAPGEGGSVGPFPGGTTVEFVVVGCNPDFVNLCFSARQGPPPPQYSNDSAGVMVTGAELASGFECGECDDFIWELRSTPAPPQDVLVLEITPARRVITPVLSGCFKAAAQVALTCVGKASGKVDTLGVAKRPDTVTVRIRTYFSPSGLPAPGASVRVVLLSASQSDSGGHEHDLSDRPKGRLFQRHERDLVDSSWAGTSNQIRIDVMPESGDSSVIYRTSGVSGVERFIGQAVLAPQVAQKTESVVVRIKDLKPLAEGGSIHLGGTDGRHPARYYGTQDMVGAIKALADSLRARVDASANLPADQRPSWPQQLEVNDMSLPWGGLFELPTSGAWQDPHMAHRVGREADIKVRGVAADDDLADAVFEIWEETMKHHVHGERLTKNHLHLQYLGK